MGNDSVTRHGLSEPARASLADHPDGPWVDAVRVVTHDRYTFYNPQLHPEFTDSDSPVLLFEATYTHTFSASQEPTPRHDYNQVLYRLDLDELP